MLTEAHEKAGNQCSAGCTIGGSSGARNTAPWSKFLYFHAVFGKKMVE